MIRVRRARVAVPVDLKDANSPGGRELRANLDWHKQGHREKFSFKAYQRQSVREALDELFHLKCAYCEMRTGADIEHFRPKGQVWVWEELRGKRTGKRKAIPNSGYWWLAADWNNLLLSCVLCNSQRKHKLPTVGYQVRGKSNYFPVQDEKKRAKSPSSRLADKSLLLDPCREDPSKHLLFFSDGRIEPAYSGKRALRASITIEACGLDRLQLVQERAKAHIWWSLAILTLQDFVVSGSGNRALVEQAYCALLWAISDEGSFSAFARQHIVPKLTPIRQDLDRLFPNATPSGAP